MKFSWGRYIHAVVQISPLSISRTFSSSQTEPMYLLDANSAYSSPQPLVVAIGLSVAMNLSSPGTCYKADSQKSCPFVPGLLHWVYCFLGDRTYFYLHGFMMWGVKGGWPTARRRGVGHCHKLGILLQVYGCKIKTISVKPKHFLFQVEETEERLISSDWCWPLAAIELIFFHSK